MPEPLKNLYSHKLIHTLAAEFKNEYAIFDIKKFTESVLSDEWNALELKDRMRHIADVLGDCLPPNYREAIEILLPVSEKFSGLEHMHFPEFIEKFGLADFEISMKALEYLTSGSSSEFAIRPFIIKFPDASMKQMALWSQSTSDHVRRLASEGCRPRLPWAMALPVFKKDPAKVLNIILKIVDDESLYVRRSVANNLNDISKDNPQLIIDVAKQYLGQSANVDWVIKHACRGLLKAGNKNILSLFGYNDANHVQVRNFRSDSDVAIGNQFNFEFELHTNNGVLGKLRLEFIIDFVKANGKKSGKIFKISEGEYHQVTRRIKKYFSFKQISTRKYYVGEHSISIVINGNRIATKPFILS
ncbi:MAG: 3-methyladenine DNA glycosylase AlkC [Oleiphilaceae bacterium]|jgi:3-methyladenine DNA glycosylase AlkC